MVICAGCVRSEIGCGNTTEPDNGQLKRAVNWMTALSKDQQSRGRVAGGASNPADISHAVKEEILAGRLELSLIR